MARGPRNLLPAYENFQPTKEEADEHGLLERSVRSNPYIFPYPGFENSTPQHIDPANREESNSPQLLPPLDFQTTEWAESFADFLMPLSIVKFDATELSESADELLYGPGSPPFFENNRDEYRIENFKFPVEKVEFIPTAEEITVPVNYDMSIPMEGIIYTSEDTSSFSTLSASDCGTEADRKIEIELITSVKDMWIEDLQIEKVKCVPRITVLPKPYPIRKNLTAIEENDLRRTVLLWANPDAFEKYMRRQRRMKRPRGLRPRRAIHAQIKERFLEKEPGYKRWRVYRHSRLANELKVTSLECFGKTLNFLKVREWDYNNPVDTRFINPKGRSKYGGLKLFERRRSGLAA